MGGALIFNTLDPLDTNQLIVRQIFESSSRAVSTNILGRYYRKKISQISGVSIKSADNLRMGSNRLHGYDSWGNETGVVAISTVSGGSATESGSQSVTITISENESAPTVTSVSYTHLTLPTMRTV